MVERNTSLESSNTFIHFMLILLKKIHILKYNITILTRESVSYTLEESRFMWEYPTGYDNEAVVAHNTKMSYGGLMVATFWWGYTYQDGRFETTLGLAGPGPKVGGSI